jgi:hypothetical protein
MHSTQLNEFSPATSLLQVGYYFDLIDNAVKTGDTNKRYTMSTNSATAPSPPIQNGSFTSFIISPTADNMCDLYNSFLDDDLNLTLKFSAAVGANVYTWTPASDGEDPPEVDPVTVVPDNLRSVWVGYKDAMDAIESYQIIVNGQSIYTQNYAIEESYITGLAATEAVKRTDVFSKTRHSDVWKKKSTVRTGALLEIADTGSPAGATVNAIIHLKIDIRRFLPLANIKYLPKFVGNFELRVKFSAAGLVCAPIPLDEVFQSQYYFSQIQPYPEISTCFTPVGQAFTQLGVINMSTKPATSAVINAQFLTVTNFTVTQCYSILHCFGLDSSVYQVLMQRYSQTALAFPVQTLSFQPMNGSLRGASNVSLTLTTTPRFVDSIFVLFPLTNDYRTIYFNPL